MPAQPWLLYGAYGYTGRLLAHEALERGHRPILAGRNRARLEALALALEEETGTRLEVRDFPLDDPGALQAGLTEVTAVLHAAGPFVKTGEPMMEGCLAAGAHYLDITGEVPVFEAAFGKSRQFAAAGLVCMPGVGLDVVPTDGVAARLAELLPEARILELALHSPGGPSPGTLQTVVEGIPGGLLVRRDGRLRRANPGSPEFRRRVDFGPEATEGVMAGRLGGSRWVSPYTWGDLSTAFRTTGIPNVTCYLSSSEQQVRLLPFLLPLLRVALSVKPLRTLLRRVIVGRVEGPSPERRASGRVRVWGRVEGADGEEATLLMEIPEGYRFTAIAGIRAMEGVLESGGRLSGTLTPAGAFGSSWVFALPEVALLSPEAR